MCSTAEIAAVIPNKYLKRTYDQSGQVLSPESTPVKTEDSKKARIDQNAENMEDEEELTEEEGKSKKLSHKDEEEDDDTTDGSDSDSEDGDSEAEVDNEYHEVENPRFKFFRDELKQLAKKSEEGNSLTMEEHAKFVICCTANSAERASVYDDVRRPIWNNVRSYIVGWAARYTTVEEFARKVMGAVFHKQRIFDIYMQHELNEHN
jgi:hypothetical protein